MTSFFPQRSPLLLASALALLLLPMALRADDGKAAAKPADAKPAAPKPAAPGEAPATPPQTPEPPIPKPREVDALDQNALQQAFRILRENYQHKDKLTDLEINRAALQGLLERHAPGAHLAPLGNEARNQEPEFPFLAAQIDDHTGYIRLSRYSQEELPELEGAIKTLRKDLRKESPHLILDLRVPAPHREVAVAALFLSYFLPDGREVFRFIKPNTGKSRPFMFTTRRMGTRWVGPMTILIDEETGNIGEIIAAGLAAHRPEISSLGATTTGRAAEYLKMPISETTALRVAVASITFPDGTSIFRTGITPRHPTAFPAVLKHARFADAQEEGGVAKVAIDTMRPRLNEAALVDGENPDIDYNLLKSKGFISPHDLIQPKDVVLQRALDMITSKRFFKDFKAESKEGNDSGKQEEGEGPGKEEKDGKNKPEITADPDKKKPGPKRLAPLPK